MNYKKKKIKRIQSNKKVKKRNVKRRYTRKYGGASNEVKINIDNIIDKDIKVDNCYQIIIDKDIQVGKVTLRGTCLKGPLHDLNIEQFTEFFLKLLFKYLRTDSNPHEKFTTIQFCNKFSGLRSLEELSLSLINLKPPGHSENVSDILKKINSKLKLTDSQFKSYETNLNDFHAKINSETKGGDKQILINGQNNFLLM